MSRRPKSKSSFHFFQYIDGQLQYDPAAGGRDKFAVFTMPYRSDARLEMEAWIEAHSTGMVCISWTEKEEWSPTAGMGSGGMVRSFSDVEYEFEHLGQATYCKVTFGGAQ